MRVQQRVYFGVISDVMSPAEISAELKATPDESSVRGATKEGPPPVPRQHHWKLHSDAPKNARIDEQLTALLDRLSPAAAAIRTLTSDGKINAAVQVVRHFNPGPEDASVLEERDEHLMPGLRLMAGQHPLLGFHIDAAIIARIAALGVSIDFDEYGDEYE